MIVRSIYKVMTKQMGSDLAKEGTILFFFVNLSMMVISYIFTLDKNYLDFLLGYSEWELRFIFLGVFVVLLFIILIFFKTRITEFENKYYGERPKWYDYLVFIGIFILSFNIMLKFLNEAGG